MEISKYFRKDYLESKGIIFNEALFNKEYNLYIAHDDINTNFKLLYKELDDVNKDLIKEIKNKFGVTYYWFYIKNKDVVYLYRRVGENKYTLLTNKLKGEALKQRILDLKELSWDSIDKLFDTKLVFNSFYNKIQSFRISLALEIKKFFVNKKIENIDSHCVSLAQKIIDRIIFTYFLAEKEGLFWVEANTSITAKEFFELLKEKNFYQELKKVFFDYFNIEYNLRKRKFYNFDTDINFKLPYLNGGLFQPQKNIRGFKEEDISISSDFDWFKLMNLLNNYSWIIRDEVPKIIEEDYEGNLTPDILGHLYEKFVITLELLGNNFTIENWEKSIQESKGKDIKKIGNRKIGAYYTPEEITTYICKNTIKPFILDKLKDKKVKIKEEELNKILEDDGYLVDKKVLNLILENLSNIKICDPACGSGAFLLKVFELLHEYIVRLNIKLKRKINFYNIAKNIISNSIYGVDIMEGAVEIAKLRLWLTLISYSQNGEFEPLLNIDYKIRRGNSLIGFDDVSILMSDNKIKSLNNWLGRKEKIMTILKKVEKEKQEFLEKHGDEAIKLSKDIKKKLEPLRKELNKIYFDEKLKSLNLSEEEKKEIEKDIFHWNLEFVEVFKPSQGGFDIVIGNPPYLMFVDIKEKFLLNCYKKLFKTYHGIGDLYTLFYEKSYLISNKKYLNISLISKNRWNNSESYKKFREFLLNFNLIIIDFNSLFVFKGSADVNTNIIFIKTHKANSNILKYYFLKSDNLSLNLKKDYYFKKIKLSKDFDWNFNKDLIVDLIEKKGEKFLDRRTGHLIAPNKIFELKRLNTYEYINKENVKIKLNKKELEVLRPYIKSSKIKKFSYSIDSYTFYLKNKNIEDFPNIKKYFEKYGKIKNRIYEYDSGNGYRSPELNDKEIKIIYPNKMYINKKNSFCLSFNFSIIGRDSYSLFLKKNISQKSILLILNSNLYWYYYLKKFKLYQGRITINGNNIFLININKKVELIFKNFSNILLFTHQIENAKYSKYFDDIANNLVYELYFKDRFKEDGIKTNLIEICEKFLKDVNYDDWIKLYFKEEKTKEEIERRNKLEKENLEIIKEVYSNMINSLEIKENIKKIQSHKWVKIIEKEIK